MTFTDYHPIENNTKYAFNVNVKKGNSEYKVAPIMYISDFNNSLVREPAILNLLTKDIYFSPLGYNEGGADQTGGQTVSISPGSEINYEGIKIKYDEFIKPDMTAMMSGGDVEMGTKLKVTKDGKDYEISPLIKIKSGQFEYIPAEVKEVNLRIEVRKIEQSNKNADLIISKINGENNSLNQSNEVLSVTASIKPFVSFVWVGVLIMVIGFFISMSRRLKDSRVIS
jgi:cytochrome c-type biogenesis protein CcmF